ncbi:MAG: 2-oxo acid dehydrogenase subunit E2, partial [Pseudomonadota bacterium]
MADDKILALYNPDTYEVVPHTNMRKTIATRLVESKVTIPHFYLTNECRLDELLSARKRLNDAGEGRYKLSVNDFIIKA